MEVKEIIELMKAMSENGMTGFELEEGDWKLSMKREKKIVAAAQTPVVMQVPGQGSMIQAADVTVMEQVSGENAEKKFPEFPRSDHLSACGDILFLPGTGRRGLCKSRRYREKRSGHRNCGSHEADE